MRFLLGWTVKLGFLAVIYLTMTGNLKVQLPETILGFEVPAQARQWVDRNSQINDIANKTQTGFKQISDSFKYRASVLRGRRWARAADPRIAARAHFFAQRGGADALTSNRHRHVFDRRRPQRNSLGHTGHQ